MESGGLSPVESKRLSPVKSPLENHPHRSSFLSQTEIQSPIGFTITSNSNSSPAEFYFSKSTDLLAEYILPTESFPRQSIPHRSCSFLQDYSPNHLRSLSPASETLYSPNHLRSLSPASETLYSPTTVRDLLSQTWTYHNSISCSYIMTYAYILHTA